MNNTLRILRKEIHKRLHRLNLAAKKMSTSLSDNQLYPDFCYKASMDSTTFRYFRLNPVYNQILEGVAKRLALPYYEITKAKNDFLNNIETFKKNDNWGSPVRYQFPEIGLVSISTMRYIKIMYDIKELFGDLSSFTMSEIGVGYGGQCRIIDCALAPKKYVLIDLKPALLLAQRYLDNYALNASISYKTMNELDVQPYDLIVSNYAFSELPRFIQEVYLKKVILNSTRGYLIMNEINPAEFNSYSQSELLSLLPNARILPEIPLTHPKNYVIVWGA